MHYPQRAVFRYAQKTPLKKSIGASVFLKIKIEDFYLQKHARPLESLLGRLSREARNSP
jgi:hypothetical protein